MDIDSTQMEKCSGHRQFPNMESEERFQTNAELQTKVSEVPNMELRNKTKDWDLNNYCGLNWTQSIQGIFWFLGWTQSKPGQQPSTVPYVESGDWEEE